MGKRKLAVIGASYLQLPLVEKAQSMGLEVHCFAWREGAVCADVADYFYPISTRDEDAILEKCQEIGIDGICTIASDVATLTVDYVADKMGLPGNPENYAQVCTNKYLMRQCFFANGVPSPRFVEVAQEKDMGKCDEFSYPLIVKPTDRSGSRGVEKVYDKEQLQQAITRAWNESFCHQSIVEEFVGGREVSVESISYKGKHHILQITDKVTTGEPFFVELEHHQPSNLPSDIQQRIRAIVLKALDALHICNGASHSELKITEDGDIKVIEIGARMGGDFIGSDLVQLSTGYDFVRGVIEVALGTFEEPLISKYFYSGVFFLSKETSAYVLPIIKNAKKYPEVVRADIEDTVLRNIESSADRSGYFIYQSEKGRFVIDEKR